MFFVYKVFYSFQKAKEGEEEDDVGDSDKTENRGHVLVSASSSGTFNQKNLGRGT